MKIGAFTISSVCLLITSSLFTQTFAETKLKKELGVCGKTLSAVLKVDPTTDAQISSAFKLEEEFCDYGRYEENANFIVYLYDANDKLIYDKHVQLNTLSVYESTDHKKAPGKIEIKNLSKKPVSRVVKFPLTTEISSAKSYKIESLDEKKMTAKKSLTWTAQ